MELVSIAVLAAMLSAPAAPTPVTVDAAPARLRITSLPQFTKLSPTRPPAFVTASARQAKGYVNYSRTQRAAMIAGGAVAGFFAGGYIGSKLEPDCRCDDPGLKGFVIGAPVGAIATAIFVAYATR